VDSVKPMDADNQAGTTRARRETFADAFSARRNSLNFIRLVLAMLVIVSHAITLGGFGSEDILNKTTLGTLAVYGFFGISGYLIAGSAAHNRVGRYLWQRFLRIVPAFWACLIITAAVFGPIAWLYGRQRLGSHCGLSCYADAQDGPFSYLVHNSWLRVSQPQISGTPVGIPTPLIWNGSLWTLFYESLCYLLLGLLALVGLLRRRVVALVLTATAWLAELLITSVPGLNSQFSVSHNWDVMNVLTFVPLFLTGALLYLYRESVPDSGTVAVGCTALFALSLGFPIGAAVPAYTLTSTAVFGVALVYPVLWLGAHLPFTTIGARNDYSYGLYVYAFPVQQLLAIWNAQRWGYFAYMFLGIVGTAPLAIGSWWLVEKHALKLKKLDFKELLYRAPTPAETPP
jgi:peptidoglycan/LPS O-acetylase OafA/YrhL